jgi:hypothetical protein
MFTSEQWAKPETLEPRENLPEELPFLRLYYEPPHGYHTCWCFWEYRPGVLLVRQARASADDRKRVQVISAEGGMEDHGSIWVRDLMIRSESLPGLKNLPENGRAADAGEGTGGGVRRGIEWNDPKKGYSSMFWRGENPWNLTHQMFVDQMIAAFGSYDPKRKDEPALPAEPV